MNENKKIIKEFNNLISLYDLDMDYPMYKVDVVKQTNSLINFLINDLYNKIDLSKIIVYEFNDDLISLIGYRILKAIQNFKPINFNPIKLVLMGKVKKTKKEFKFKEKRISVNKVKRHRQRYFLISSFNPIYKVGSINHISTKNLFEYDYNLMKSFMPQEILTARIFYYIGYLKEMRKIDGKKINIWNDDYLLKIEDEILNNSNKYFTYTDIPKFKLVYLTGELESDKILLRSLEQWDGIILYYGDKVNEDLLCGFNCYVKKKINRYKEKNNYKLGNYIFNRNRAYKECLWTMLVGEWPEEAKSKIMEDTSK